MIDINFIPIPKRNRRKYWLTIILISLLCILSLQAVQLWFSINLQEKIVEKELTTEQMKTTIKQFDLLSRSVNFQKKLLNKSDKLRTSLQNILNIHNQLAKVTMTDIRIKAIEHNLDYLTIVTLADNLKQTSDFVDKVTKLDIFASVEVVKINNMNQNSKLQVAFKAYFND